MVGGSCECEVHLLLLMSLFLNTVLLAYLKMESALRNNPLSFIISYHFQYEASKQIASQIVSTFKK